MIHTNRDATRALSQLAFALFAILGFASASRGQTAPAFSKLVVFGDSLSDTGNIANLTGDITFGAIRYPSEDFNYADGRFTNDTGTNPGNTVHDGVWHEQLAQILLNLPRAKDSTDGGLNYAYGGATTENGTNEVTVISNPIPFAGGQLGITIKNVGQQVSDFLASGTPDPAALYILWGGGNDLFNDDSAANVTAAASRVTALVNSLARAGAVNFLVPNVPPVGDVPHYQGQAQQPALDAASASYRDQLSADLDALQLQLNAAGIPFHLYRLDIYTLFIQLVQNPATYNLTNVTQSAQGQNVDPDNYLFWDDIHPTTAGHFQIATEAYRVLSRPLFFSGEVPLGSNTYYLELPNGNLFGYYNDAYFPYVYHFDLGFEYVIDAHDNGGGIYLYDFTSGHFWYTSTTFPFPFLYDFNLSAFLEYLPANPPVAQHYSSAPRQFADFNTGTIIVQ